VPLGLAVVLAVAAPLVVSEIPLFVASGNRPNVLLTVANSNSMDEDATGLAVGSAAPNSKSEIARRVAKNLIDDRRIDAAFAVRFDRLKTPDGWLLRAATRDP